PEERFVGGGIYHPDMPALTRIRQRIATDQKAWKTVLASGLEIEGDRLVRAPAGFGPGPPVRGDLQPKELYPGAHVPERRGTSKDFRDRFMGACEDVSPLVKFLTEALGLRW